MAIADLAARLNPGTHGDFILDCLTDIAYNYLSLVERPIVSTWSC